MTQIKLIQPLMHMRPMDTHLKNRMSPPLGLYTIAAMFRDEYEVIVENENVRAVDMTDIPDIVGVSVNVDSLPRALKIADVYLNRGIPVVLGGILPTTAPDEIPEMGRFDYLYRGSRRNVARHHGRPSERNPKKSLYLPSLIQRRQDSFSRL